METVGVALGGISLVIAALENYRTCATFFDDYTHHEALLSRKKNYLWLQKEQLETTLRSIGLETSPTDDGRDDSSLEKVVEHLRKLYPDDPDKSEKFVAIIQHMNEISRLAASRLNGGSSEQVSRPHFVRPQVSFRTLTHSLVEMARRTSQRPET